MPQICGQQRHPGGDVSAVAVPACERPDRHRVSQVMDSRGVHGVCSYPGQGGDPAELGLGERGDEPLPAGGDEQCRICRCRAQRPAPLEVIPQRGDHGRIDRDPPGLAVLGIPDRDHRLLHVRVGVIKADSLAEPHAGRGNQPEQGGVGDGGQVPAVLPGSREQRGDLLPGEDVGLVPAGRAASIPIGGTSAAGSAAAR